MWHWFANWLYNSNYAGMLLGALCPGVLVMAHTRWEHHKTRQHLSPDQPIQQETDTPDT